MLSRRAVLIGGGATVALAAAGAVGATTVGTDKVLHKLGLSNSPDHTVPRSRWEVQEHVLVSAAMHRDVKWAIALPPQGARAVIVCLHGRTNDRRYPFDVVHLHDVVASVGASLAVAGVDGGRESYWHPRKDGTDPLSMVINEFIPAVDELIGSQQPRAVLGWSMGGYGALLVAEQAPQLFTAVAAASPALWRNPGESRPGAFDGPEDFERYNVFTSSARLNRLAVRVDCGTGDGFVRRARQFAQQLPSPNLGGFGPGYHDASYWRSIAPAQVATIAATFGA